jgi:hypothetical protein
MANMPRSIVVDNLTISPITREFCALGLGARKCNMFIEAEPPSQHHRCRVFSLATLNQEPCISPIAVRRPVACLLAEIRALEAE